MSDDNNVFVGIHLDPLKAATPAGVLTFSESGDGRVWFEYNPRYIEMIDDGSAFELAPSGLKATKSPIELPNAEYPGVFGDSAPDFWGQLVLRRLFGLNNITPVERLVYSGEDRIGALTFRHRSIRGRSSALPTKNVLSRYGRFIMSMEDGAAPLTDEDLKAAALAGSSAGGARPKCSFREDDGTVWLAKFSLPKDAPLSVPSFEHASMVFAKRFNINVAKTVFRRTGKDESVVLVQRFDRLTDGSRIPFASMQTIVGGKHMKDGSYPDMALKLRNLSCQPEADATELFRRMIYNAICGNTDDHLKNHAMIRTEKGWRLSPSYDVTPQAMPDGLQALAVGKHGAMPTIENLLSEHAAFCLSHDDAKETLGNMLNNVSIWKDLFRAEGVSDSDIEALEMGDCYIKVPPEEVIDKSAGQSFGV